MIGFRGAASSTLPCRRMRVGDMEQMKFSLHPGLFPGGWFCKCELIEGGREASALCDSFDKSPVFSEGLYPPRLLPPPHCPFRNSRQHKEQRKEQLSLGDAFRAAEDVSQYLGQWRSLVAGHIAALEELQECLDQAALDGLRALTLSLSQRAAEELWRLQNSAVAQELLRRGVPWLFLQQVLEEHSKETAARAEQLEAEERDRDQEGVQSVRQRLKEDDLEAATEEQAELRRWQRCIFA